MKKTLNLLFLITLGLLLNSCFSNTCNLKGCDREAIGWKYYETIQPGPFGGCIGACRIESTGGYCSKEHVYEDIQ